MMNENIQNSATKTVVTKDGKNIQQRNKKKHLILTNGQSVYLKCHNVPKNASTRS